MSRRAGRPDLDDQLRLLLGGERESDGTTPAGSKPPSEGTAGPGNGMKGANLLLDMSFRAVVRESYFPSCDHVVQGGGAYGSPSPRTPATP